MRNPCRALFAGLALLGAVSLQADGPSLADRFRQPPPETASWCFWYWINNHVSRTGITHDLEAMKRFGIGTALIGNDYFPTLAEGDVPMLSERFWDLTAFAVHEGRRLGVDIGFFNTPGWSQSGGPWIKESESMRFLNWSETRAEGGRVFSAILPVPRVPFQDVAVIAVPVPPEDGRTIGQLAPAVDELQGSDPAVTDPAGNLVDGDHTTGVRFPAGRADWTVTLTAPHRFTARSLTLYPNRADFLAQVELQAADGDGKWRTLRSFFFDRSNNRLEVGARAFAPLVIAFPATTATQWRLRLTGIVTKDPDAGLAEIELSPAPRVEKVVEKQLMKLFPTPKPMWDAYVWGGQAEPERANLTTAPDKVVDLTGKMRPDGQLTWDAPRGHWVILRIGMNTTGVTNHPAPPNATGLEVDKLNREAAHHHYEAFMGRLEAHLNADDRKALKYLAIDSYETGAQDWTDGFGADFQRHYGYDPRPWLPVLTGRIVGSADRSNRFLWDLRRLVADRVAYEYVGELARSAHADGAKLWLENYGHWGFPAEFLQYGGEADLVSGEFWQGKPLGDIEIRAASSAAHIYGKPTTYVEAFTSSHFWTYGPYEMKARGDWAFGEGANHMVLQVYIHQPGDTPPGLNAWFGTEFNRLVTWWEPGRAWNDYLRRCALMLHEGRNVADLAYFIGEDAPKMTGVRDPALPRGHSFDYINAEVILKRLTVENGRFVLPDGTSYGVLVLPPERTMRPEVAEKIARLAREGGAIFGPAPERSPSLQDFPRADERVRRAAEAIRPAGATLEAALAARGLGRDVDGLDPDRTVWVHRSAPEREVYFVSNQTDDTVALSPVFRVRGRAPELWDAVSGDVHRTRRFAAEAAGTRVDFTLGPRGSVFVVFPRGSDAAGGFADVTRDGRPSDAVVEAGPSGVHARVAANGTYEFRTDAGNTWTVRLEDLPAPQAIRGPWTIHFPPHRDVPETVEWPELASWTDSRDEALRHFSGTAEYVKTFDAAVPAAGRHVFLDLGGVGMLAETRLNGHDLGVSWLPPYRVEVTRWLKDGANELRVKVTNLWFNRIAGDLTYPNGYPGHSGPKQFQATVLDSSRFNPKAPLQVSGLLGPVRLETEADLPLAGPP